MAMRIAINGFGRIGRMVLRALCEKSYPNIEVVAINDLGDSEQNAHLFTYDSVHGIFKADVSISNNYLNVGNDSIKMLAEREPQLLPWKDLNVDLVLECTGRFTSHDTASSHLSAGAKRVLVSAPTTNADITVVYGVNHKSINSSHQIISNASCTTNCLAPVAKILNDTIGIEAGFMTTIHAYTGDQCLVDTLHKDLRRSRAAALSMIPSSTGAAKAVGLVLPELKGKLDGTAIRIPCANVSAVDLKFTSNKKTSINEINSILKKASETELAEVLAYNDKPLVSIDFNHHSSSSIFDATQTQVVGDNFCRILSWYDNEWGFANRMCDVAKYIGDTHA